MQTPPDKIQFGLLPRTTKFGDGTFPCYAERFGLLPRDEWQPVSMSRHVWHIFSQLSTMCTSNAGSEAMMVERAFRGREEIVVSPEWLHRMRSEWGQGASLDEVLRVLISHGTVSRENFFKADDWKEWVEQPEPTPEAHRFKLLEAIDLGADFDAVATAIRLRKPCVIGVRWPGTRGGGHAVCVTELAEYARGKWSLRGPNSWGADWNENGFFSLTEKQCGDFRQFGAWCVGVSVCGYHYGPRPEST